jgi:hypothetical protein
MTMLQGCGAGSEKKPPTAEQSSQSAKQDDSASNEASSKDSQSNGKDSEKPSPENKDQKYVDGIPYDVFFDRPLQIAADGTMLTDNNQASKTIAEKTPENMTKQTPVSTTNKGAETTASWDKYISEEMLQGEIKRIRNKLNSKLNSVGNFNRELLSIQIDAATLAALAAIVPDHSGKFTWKEKAKYVRDFAAEIAVAAENRGRPAFEKAEKPFLNIIEILDGGTPAELPDSEDKADFSDAADRNLLMKNLKEKQDWIRTTISGESELKSNQEDLLPRVALLAALGQVVNQEDYVFADEENYQKYCKDLIEGSLMMTEATKQEDFTKFKKGFELFNKSCNDCHPEYLNN